MTEPKKVAFTTLGSTKKEKKRHKKTKSVRLNLPLSESTEKFCPEFNYRELVSMKLHEKLGKKRLGDVINGPALDPTDPFAQDEDAALKALAKQMESKYGNSYAPAKKRRKENDFSTLGEGYDETDPFIDNSDAFDEVVPTNLETKHRGFYINSGELDFEEVAHESGEEDSEPSDSEVKRKKNVRRIESDDEDDREPEERVDEDEDSNKGDKTVVENGIIRAKKRKLDEGELLRKRKKMIGKFNAKSIDKRDSDPETETKIPNGCENKGEPPNELSIAASIEAVISKAREEAVDKKSDTQESASGSDSSSSDSDSSGSSSSSDSDSDDDDDDDDEKEGGDNDGEDGDEEAESQEMENGHQYSESTDDIPLPEDLPQDLILVLKKLKEEGRACKGSSQKFFTDSVNRLLLSIVFKLNKLGGRKKTQIYNHLSQHLPCTTQTIVKRSKNLLSEKQENKLREPLKRLKDAINAQMPAMMEEYVRECQKAAEAKGENGTAAQNEEEEDGEKKKNRLPKKKFVFTDDIRMALREIVKVRVQFWHLIKKRSENMEEHVRAFLDSDVRPLWPKGWMNARILFKESFDEQGALNASRAKSSTPSKKMVSLGGGSVSSSVSNVNTQPPKPSLSATVIPKNFPSSVSSSPKSDVQKKKVLSVDPLKTNPKMSVESGVSCATTASGGISIKSVERINQCVDKTMPNIKSVSDFSITKEKSVKSKSHSSEGSTFKNKISERKLSNNDDVSVIDLSSDDDRTVMPKVTPNVSPKSSKSSDLTQDELVEKESASPPVEKETGSITEGKKDDNLEEEMNLVMNEILQISKQKSVDESPDKLTCPKDSSIGQSSKGQSEDQKKVQNVIDKQQQHSSSNVSPLQSSDNSSKKITSVQSNISPPKSNHPSIQSEKVSLSSNSSSHNNKYSQKSNAPLSQFEKYSQEVGSGQPKNNRDSVIAQDSSKKSSPSSAQPDKYSVQSENHSQKTNTLSGNVEVSQKARVVSVLPDRYSQNSNMTLGHQGKYSQKDSQHVNSSSPTDKFSYKQGSLPVHGEKYSSKDPTTTSSNAQHTTTTGKQHRSSHHSSPIQDQQRGSLSSPVEQRKIQQQQSPRTSSVDPVRLPSQHNLSTHKKSPTNVQSNSGLHSHSLSNQQTSVKQSHLQHQSGSSQKSNSQAQVGLPFSSHSHQFKQVSDVSHKNIGSQQYKQPHMQSSPSQKSINVSVTSWNSPNSSLSSKHSPESTKKSHTSWASSSDMGRPRQKQSDDLNVVVQVDPLANLRMMHGLSVSNANKKSSGSSSIYENLVLATSASSYTTTSSAKMSGTNSSSVKQSSSSNIQNQSKNTGYSTHIKQSSPSTHSSSKSSKHISNSKSRLESYSGNVSQSSYSNVSPEQMNAYKQQLQQHQKQANHLTQQHELWQQMNPSNYLPGLGTMPNADMRKLVNQVNKSHDNYSQSGPYQSQATTHPTSVSSHHHNPYGDSSRGNQHTHHISSHHLHPTHGGSDQHRGQY